jgi:serine/threonine protein kinase
VPDLIKYQEDLDVGGEKHPVIVLEYLGLNTLENYIKAQKNYETKYKKLPSVENEWLWAGVAKMFLKQLTTLHDANYSHRDIKSENLMLTEDLLEGKFIDLGFAEPDAPYGELQSKRGTRAYAAPELGSFDDKNVIYVAYQGFEVDLFAFGILLFYMVTGEFPWFEASNKRISEGNPGYSDIYVYELFDTFWKYQEDVLGRSFTKNFKLIFQGLVIRDPSARLSLA